MQFTNILLLFTSSLLIFVVVDISIANNLHKKQQKLGNNVTIIFLVKCPYTGKCFILI